jgi:hypothetical protein
MSDMELESFKQIDLRAYAASGGYVLDRKESWRGSAVMRHPNGSKIIIKRNADDNHYLYFSVRDDRDNGSIIDFVANRKNLSLGAIRKELRPWIGKSAAELPAYPALHVTQKDRVGVEIEFAKMSDALRHPYLENERGLSAELLQRACFQGRIKIDRRGNAVFPHFDRNGLCGFESKNSGFTSFASGGTKGLWSSIERQDDNCLVFCEGAIDALSYAALFPDPQTRYASIGGQVSPVQKELIRAAAAGMPAKSKIVAAFDSDAAGAELAGVVRAAVDVSDRDDLCFVFHEPFGFKDWNDQLRGKSKRLLPYRPEEPSVA